MCSPGELVHSGGGGGDGKGRRELKMPHITLRGGLTVCGGGLRYQHGMQSAWRSLLEGQSKLGSSLSMNNLRNTPE